MNGCDPLSPDEYLLRRISAFKVDENSLDEVIPWTHFTPRKEDTDGLSVTRETAKTPEQMVEGSKNKHGYYVSRIQVKELIAIGLMPVPTEQYGIGHVSIPELSYQAFKRDEVGAQKKMRNLAKLAWEGKVLGPTPPCV
jgi:hypothetical protein